VAGEGEGAVKGLCARMQAHADVRQCAVLASQRGLTPLSLSLLFFRALGRAHVFSVWVVVGVQEAPGKRPQPGGCTHCIACMHLHSCAHRGAGRARHATHYPEFWGVDYQLIAPMA